MEQHNTQQRFAIKLNMFRLNPRSQEKTSLKPDPIYGQKSPTRGYNNTIKSIKKHGNKLLYSDFGNFEFA